MEFLDKESRVWALMRSLEDFCHNTYPKSTSRGCWWERSS
jgi:hypothetical protein